MDTKKIMNLGKRKDVFSLCFSSSDLTIFLSLDLGTEGKKSPDMQDKSCYFVYFTKPNQILFFTCLCIVTVLTFKLTLSTLVVPT